MTFPPFVLQAASISVQIPQKRDLCGIPRQIIGRFQAEGKALQQGVIGYSAQCRRSDAALANFCVPVFVGAQGIHTVVEVDGLKPLQPQHPVEFCQHAWQVSRHTPK